MMTISIALATFNGERFLREQLDSLAAQTLRPAELVVSDDGSIDGTLQVVRAFAVVAPFPVRILDKSERLGFADNFLYAAEACTSDLVAFCDQDDVWLPKKLELMHGRLERDGSMLAMHTLQATDEMLQPSQTFSQGIRGDSVFAPLQLDTYRTGWGNSMLFSRDLVTLIPHSERPRQMQSDGRPLSHDTWIYTIAAALGRVSHIAQPLILYRQHGNNVYGINVRKSHWENLRDRLITWGAVPMYEMNERRLLYQKLARLFRDVACRPSHPLGPVASAAAERFAEQEKYMETRLALFSASRIKQRLSAFHRARCAPGMPRRRLAARMKEMLLGVTGLYKLFPQRSI